jgi:integrase/recombinase XerD
VYFSLKAKIWLKWYIDSRTDEDKALFVTERAPRRMSVDMIRYVVKRVGKQAKLDQSVYPHLWRHTFATHMLNRGAPLEGVQDLLGHAKIETTKIYCQLSGARRKQIHTSYF